MYSNVVRRSLLQLFFPVSVICGVIWFVGGTAAVFAQATQGQPAQTGAAQTEAAQTQAARTQASQRTAQAQATHSQPAPAPIGQVAAKPSELPARWKGLIGTFQGPGQFVIEIFEKDGLLEMQVYKEAPAELREESENHFAMLAGGQEQAKVQFVPGPGGVAKEFVFGDVYLSRHLYGGDNNKSALIKPVKPLNELRKEALAATPPAETGNFRKPDLVELVTLDPQIKLDIRYAGTSNFLGEPVYSQARAFLQRPAAQGVAAALKFLKPYGYGLVIYDGYRPWHVTKLFWEATPPAGKIFVADPSQGSRHNRGCAVDLSLYDLKTGEPVEMPGTYDEMSPRSFPLYGGGTSLQRWRRDLLRAAMEASGFTVYEEEWWHFDYKDWREYGILNVKFEGLGSTGAVQ